MTELEVLQALLALEENEAEYTELLTQMYTAIQNMEGALGTMAVYVVIIQVMLFLGVVLFVLRGHINAVRK